MEIQRKLNILLMDDGRSESESLLSELQCGGPGHRLKVAESKESFVGALSEFKPNLIIADYRFPDFDGNNFRDIARRSDPNMMFILVERKLGEEIIIELMRDGQNDFKLIDKPANFIPAMKSAILKASRGMKEVQHANAFHDILDKLDSSHEGIVKADRNNLVIKCNKTFFSALGFEADKVSDSQIEKFVDGNDLKTWKASLETMMIGGSSKSEIRFIKRDGSVLCGGIHILKNLDNDGNYSGYYCFVEDIGEKKQAEQSIREAQNITAASLNSLNERVAILDGDGVITAVNRAWTAYALQNGGNPKESSAGVNYIDQCDAPEGRNLKERKEFAEGIRKVLNGDISEFVIRYPAHTPLHKRWFTAKVSKFFGEGSRKAVVIHSDITKTVLAEIELEKNEEKFRNLVKHSSDIISIISAHGAIKYASPSAARIFGEETKYREGRNVFDFIHPDDAGKVKTAFEKGFSLPNETVSVEFRYRKPDGDYIYLESVASNLLLDPSVEGIVVNSREITDRKLAEEHSIAAMNEKDELLKEVHHRVKNNLQIVSSLLKLQEDHINEASFKKVFKESINRIKAMSLIHQRLYQEQRLSKINFGMYLSSIVEFLKETYDANSRNIKCKIETENLDLNLETAVPCGLLINELVSNSLRHAFEGRESGELFIRMQSNGNNVITISDNGIGLPIDFELGKANTLGLEMAHNLAAELNADIEVRNDNGATFIITFGNLNYKQRVKEEKI